MINSREKQIYIGTCSWTDKSLIGSGEFYPKNLNTSESRLKYYSGFFNTVEVDSSFYALPSERNAHLWVERTPERFLFNIKAYSAMTAHQVNVDSLPQDMRKFFQEVEKRRIFIKDREILKDIFMRFCGSIAPLYSSRKLGLVVFQYPPWFENTKVNKDYILFCKSQIGHIDMGVEFRNNTWLENAKKGDTLNFLRENKLFYIISDAPQVNDKRTVQYVVDAAGDLAYFRFHGKNTENWLKKDIDVSLRYDYEYSKEELEGFAQDIKMILSRVKKVFALFNNHRGTQAIRSALALKRIFEQ